MDWLNAGLDHLQEPAKINCGSEDLLYPSPPGLGGGDAEEFKPWSAEEFSAALIANQNAAIEVENARLIRDSTLMRLRSQSMAGAPSLPPGLHEDMENPYMLNPWEMPQMGLYQHGYMSTPWDVQQPWCQDDMSFANSAPWVAPNQGSGASWFAHNPKRLHLKRNSFAASESTASGDLSSLSSFQSSMVSDEPETEVLHALSSTPPHLRTTVMMRHVPNNLTRDQLIQLLNDEGLENCYNLVYLPIDFKSRAGLGYAFIDFLDNTKAESFFHRFQGFSGWIMQSDKVCDVTWSAALQGIHDHVKRYRNSPVMHETVSDEFRPVLFKDGERVAFPEPTKRIRAPRQWPRRH